MSMIIPEKANPAAVEDPHKQAVPIIHLYKIHSVIPCERFVDVRWTLLEGTHLTQLIMKTAYKR